MRRVDRSPSGRPIAPLWVGWIWIVRRVLFRRRLPVWLTDGVYRHGPNGLKRAYGWVGAAQNPDNELGW